MGAGNLRLRGGGVDELCQQAAEVVVPQARPLGGIMRIEIGRTFFLGDVELCAEHQSQLIETLHPGHDLRIVEVIGFERDVQLIEMFEALGEQVVPHETLVLRVAVGIAQVGRWEQTPERWIQAVASVTCRRVMQQVAAQFAHQLSEQPPFPVREVNAHQRAARSEPCARHRLTAVASKLLLFVGGNSITAQSSFCIVAHRPYSCRR